MSKMHKSHAYLRESVDRLLREACSRWRLTRYEANVLVGRAIRHGTPFLADAVFTERCHLDAVDLFVMEGNKINSLIDLVLDSDTADAAAPVVYAELELLKQQGCTFAKVVRRIPDDRRQAGALPQSALAEAADLRAAARERAVDGAGGGAERAESVPEMPAASRERIGAAGDPPAAPAGRVSV